VTKQLLDFSGDQEIRIRHLFGCKVVVWFCLTQQFFYTYFKTAVDNTVTVRIPY
jgi:hypothetical protein